MTRYMKPNLHFSFLVVFLLSLAPLGARGQGPDVRGVVLDGVYRNELLGFELKTPPGWSEAANDEFAFAMEAGKRDAQIAVTGKTRDVGILGFMYAQKRAGLPENSVVGLSVSRQISDRITARQVAEALRDGFQRHPDYFVSQDIQSEKINGRDFVIVDIGQKSFPKQRIRSYMFSEKEYVVAITMTYWNNYSFGVMLDSLNSIKFFKK